MQIGVVGAGPAGLYLCLLLLSKYSKEKIPVHLTLFEANERVGGRTQMGEYHGRPVVSGAGVVRKDDVRLRKLCRRFRIPLHRFTTHIQYPKPHQSKTLFLSLLDSFSKKEEEFQSRETFSENFKRLMGPDVYQDFVEMAGYTDYEHANVYDTLRDYGWKDNTAGQTMYRINWNQLTDAMLDYLTSTYPPTQFQILLHCPITKVSFSKKQKQFHLSSSSPNLKDVDILFWTTPRPHWKPILQWIPPTIYQQLHGQPFLRAYADVSDELSLNPKSTTYTTIDCPLQKIIPIEPPLYMISYSDNQRARKAVKMLKTLEKKKDDKLIQDPKLFFWPCGTHYFSPSSIRTLSEREKWLQQACHPCHPCHPHSSLPLYLAGEGLSTNQGWTEGALESVERVLSIF
jgi:hypothetical protein